MSFSVSSASFEHVKYLGEGGFGLVSVVKKIGGVDAEVNYAMKCLKKSKAYRSEAAKGQVKTEIEVLKKLDGTFFVKLCYSFESKHLIHLVMDMVDGCDLFAYLHRVKKMRQKLGLKLTRFFAAQLVLAIDYLHCEGMAYRDLKPENIMVDRDGYIKLIDFGYTKSNVKNDMLMYTFAGTTTHLPPEGYYPQKGYTWMVDWWSLGIVVHEMYFGRIPFDSRDVQELWRQIEEDKLVLPKSADAGLKKLLQKLLEKDPIKRAGSDGLAELKKFDFFKNVDFEALASKKLLMPLKEPIPTNEELDIQDIDRSWFEKSEFDGFGDVYVAEHLKPKFEANVETYVENDENVTPNMDSEVKKKSKKPVRETKTQAKEELQKEAEQPQKQPEKEAKRPRGRPRKEAKKEDKPAKEAEKPKEKEKKATKRKAEEPPVAVKRPRRANARYNN
ncbi:unnamed protein product [Bursaphelenchus okinawaensis]|uniref:Protein kinase domain-containing protein n=1 Tax=Bursaphelenchus okinawaensis TaxID=465554 RepID=A0A811KAZ3_9BILA|nr:unnamed protein product [Bursaphelenchus okinawaensis]CAG9097060.1 unnamed protein product [Bursaphelenchus okinawaensis]